MIGAYIQNLAQGTVTAPAHVPAAAPTFTTANAPKFTGKGAWIRPNFYAIGFHFEDQGDTFVAVEYNGWYNFLKNTTVNPTSPRFAYTAYTYAYAVWSGYFYGNYSIRATTPTTGAASFKLSYYSYYD